MRQHCNESPVGDCTPPVAARSSPAALACTSCRSSFRLMFHSWDRPLRGPRSSTATRCPRSARAAAVKMPRVPPHTTTSYDGSDASGWLVVVTNGLAAAGAAPGCSQDNVTHLSRGASKQAGRQSRHCERNPEFISQKSILAF